MDTKTNSFTSQILAMACTVSKLFSENNELSSTHSNKGMSKNKITPDMRCKMETIAGKGNLIVVKFKFTGRFLFTITILSRCGKGNGSDYSVKSRQRQMNFGIFQLSPTIGKGMLVIINPNIQMFILFPFNRRGWFPRNIIHNPCNTTDFIDDSIRNPS